MSNIIYHPITGVKTNVNSLKSEEIRSPNRLYKPKEWKQYYYKDENLDQTRLFGLEFEFNACSSHAPIDFDMIGKEILKALNHNGQHVHILEDHSVRNGVEIIFHPMSYQYMKHNIDFHQFFKVIQKLGLTTTHDTGFHIHVNLKPSLRERNLMLRLFSISYPLWLKLSQRKIMRLQNRYVSTEFFMMTDKIRDRHITNLQKILETKTSYVSFKDLHFDNYDVHNRYNAINFNNPHTTEFRLFGGTDEFNHFVQTFNFVVNFIALVDEISQTRIDDVFNLNQYVKRTNSQKLLNDTYKQIKKAEQLIRHNRLYYNHFYLLDTYWYESTFKHIQKHDYLIKKRYYNDYLKLMSNLNKLNPVTDNHHILRIKEDINDFLLGVTYEIVKKTNNTIEIVPVINSTFKSKIPKDKVEQEYTLLRCINRDLLMLFF